MGHNVTTEHEHACASGKLKDTLSQADITVWFFFFSLPLAFRFCFYHACGHRNQATSQINGKCAKLSGSRKLLLKRKRIAVMPFANA